MSEKEFLVEFAKRYETLNLNYPINDNTRETFIDQFLKQYHYKYFEVEFVKKDIEEIRLSHMCQCSICDPD